MRASDRRERISQKGVAEARTGKGLAAARGHKLTTACFLLRLGEGGPGKLGFPPFLNLTQVRDR
jgi:hypothetical protein